VLHAFTYRLPFEGRPRRVRVVVPQKVEAHPPLLVLFDGQNVFDHHRSHAGGWHAHDAVNKLASTIRRPVIVAVDHGGRGRLRELWGELDAFLHFVMRDALPEAERKLGTSFDPAMRVVGGASLGGLASLGAIARHPSFFSGALAMSPSAWFVPSQIYHELQHVRLRAATRVYIDVGERESEAMVREAGRVAGLLAGKLHPEQRMWRPDKRGRHRELDWQRRLPKALRFLFRA